MLKAFLPMFQGNRKAELYLKGHNIKKEGILRIVEYRLSILDYLLFAREYTSKHLHGIVFALKFKPPYVLFFCAINQ